MARAFPTYEPGNFAAYDPFGITKQSLEKSPSLIDVYQQAQNKALQLQREQMQVEQETLKLEEARREEEARKAMEEIVAAQNGEQLNPNVMFDQAAAQAAKRGDIERYYRMIEAKYGLGGKEAQTLGAQLKIGQELADIDPALGRDWHNPRAGSITGEISDGTMLRGPRKEYRGNTQITVYPDGTEYQSGPVDAYRRSPGTITGSFYDGEGTPIIVRGTADEVNRQIREDSLSKQPPPDPIEQMISEALKKNAEQNSGLKAPETTSTGKQTKQGREGGKIVTKMLNGKPTRFRVLPNGKGVPID